MFGREKWLKQELWGGSFWSSGYYVGTVGEKGNWTSVETYDLEQGKPKEELRQLRLW
ncbi:MAG: transposase [Verrucomicrobia bacterium]|nr:transposase [Verrucomicrobiota bacterium]MDA1069755.1 transposase [Verrucomicrobiota bacterium]